MAERICKRKESVLKEFRQVIKDMKNATNPSLRQESQDYARRQLLRGAAESGDALRLKLLLRTYEWSDEAVTEALLAVTSRRTAYVIARARPHVFQASAPLAVQDALRREDVSTLRELLDAGAAVDEPHGFLNETPLHVAASYSNSHCAQELLLRGADPNARDKTDQTPLHRAAYHGRTAVLCRLVHSGASVNARCLRKQTPLHCAVSSRHVRGVATLLDMEADVTLKDSLGLTPLHSAASAIDHIVLVYLLLRYEANPEAQTNSGLRPIHYAATAGNFKAIRLLVNAGADVHARTWDGDTALHIAASADRTACVEELARCGADVHARDRRGLTPLHVATAHGRVEALRALLRLGADVELQAVPTARTLPTLAVPSITPLMIAVQRRDEACGRALIEAGADIPTGILLGYLGLLRQNDVGPQEEDNPTDS